MTIINHPEYAGPGSALEQLGDASLDGVQNLSGLLPLVRSLCGTRVARMDPFHQIPVMGIFGRELHIKVAATSVENEPRRIQK